MCRESASLLGWTTYLLIRKAYFIRVSHSTQPGHGHVLRALSRPHQKRGPFRDTGKKESVSATMSSSDSSKGAHSSKESPYEAQFRRPDPQLARPKPPKKIYPKAEGSLPIPTMAWVLFRPSFVGLFFGLRDKGTPQILKVHLEKITKWVDQSTKGQIALSHKPELRNSPCKRPS